SQLRTSHDEQRSPFSITLVESYFGSSGGAGYPVELEGLEKLAAVARKQLHRISWQIDCQTVNKKQFSNSLNHRVLAMYWAAMAIDPGRGAPRFYTSRSLGQ